MSSDDLSYELSQSRSNRPDPHQLQAQTSDNSDIAKEYRNLVEWYSNEVFTSAELEQQAMEEHQVRYINNQDSILLKEDVRLGKSDCIFSVVKTQFRGLQYTYEILIGPFLLRIQVLNLNRNSDDGDEDIYKEEVGSGGFGSVRAVRINDQQFAIKRIPFRFKLDQGSGYDLQTESSEQNQLRRCLREFCMFKICSLLGIGPKLIRGSYDLICFNNCIEFRMQLCESIASNQFYITHKEISMPQIRLDLMRKLVALHSLNIVHRDIKPENILYSPMRKSVVFGDFGMNLIIKENCSSQTFTTFAGTPNFCSPEMRKLLNGEQGYVNLYLNDYHSLKETFNCLENNIIKQDSEISRNNMSYNQDDDDQLSDFHNFSINNNSNGSSRNQTDGAYSSTGQSLVNFTTASTQAPKKLATSINHHESQIIHILCRKSQRRESFKSRELQSMILERVGHLESKDLIENLTVEIANIFFQDKINMTTNLALEKTGIADCLKEWKNASRHYGPQSEYTLQFLERIIDQIAKQTVGEVAPQDVIADLTSIKELLRHRVSQQPQMVEMVYYRRLGHFHNYCLSFIGLIRNQLNKKEKRRLQAPAELLEISDNFAQQYLFTCKNRQITLYHFRILNFLLVLYFNDLEADCFETIRFNRLQTHEKIEDEPYDLARICYQYLRSRKKLNHQNISCYISYIVQYCKDHIDFAISLANNLIEEQRADQNNLQLRMMVAGVVLRLAEIRPEYLDYIQEVVKQTIAKLQEQNHYDATVMKVSLMISYLKKNQYLKTLQVSEEIVIATQKYKEKILHINYIDLVRLKAVAQCFFLLKDHEKSEKYYQQALQLIQRHYGLTRVQEMFDITNNLALICYERKDIRSALRYFQNLNEILQFGDRKSLNLKKIYVYQEIVSLRAEIGIKTEADEIECREFIEKIITKIYENVPRSQVDRYTHVIGALNHHHISSKDKYFLERESIKIITEKNYIQFYQKIYLNIVVSISKYLIREMGFVQKGLKYLWKYIEFKDSRPYSLTEYDFDVYNLFASILMSSNSSRRAIIFLKRYIFKIPSSFYQAKQRAFSLMYKATTQTNEKMTKYYYELIKNDFHVLFNKNYILSIQKQKSPYKKLLLKKWFEKV